MQALAHPRFELVPIRGVEEQAGYLPPGATATITCSPTRGNENTLAAAELLVKHDLRVVPHISARLVADLAHLRSILRRVADLGLTEVFVIGGDAKTPAGVYSGALELLRDMAHIGHDLTDIGVAAYPEGHPLIDDATLLQALHDKQCFASYMVTQITFDPDVVAGWLGRVRQEGIELPAYIGLPGVVDTMKLLQISMRIGVGDSLRFLRKRAGLVAGLLGRSGYQPTDFVEGLTPILGDPEYRVRGLHINTFNQVKNTEEWRNRMLHMSHEPRAVSS